MTAQNQSRADALTDEQRIGLEKAMAWCPHGSSEANTIRELLAASPVEQPEAAPIDRAEMVKSWGEISSQMFAKMTPWQFYEAGWTAARSVTPAPSPADERAALSEDRIDWIANAHCPNGTAYPVNVKNAIREALREARINFDETGAEAVALPRPVLDALRFYANGHHFNIDEDHQQFDTVSGEPQNWLFSERDDDCTMIEDGRIAKAVLQGIAAPFEEPPPPIEGEVFAAPQPAQPAAREVLTDEQREALQHAINAAEEDCAYTTATTLRTIIATHPRQPGQPERTDTHGWLRSGSLLYRLTDERHPQNRDEINVTMAGGSRADAGRIARAVQLLEFLSRQPEPRAEVTDEQPSLTNPLTPYGMLVRALRIVSGTTLMDMAKALLTTPAKLSAMEFGRAPITLDFALDVAAYFDALGVPDTLVAIRRAIDAARTGASS